MRAKVILTIIAGLLFCTLSTLELPELLKLVDDTSNDYSLTVNARESLPPVTEEEAPHRTDLSAPLAARHNPQPAPVRFSHSLFGGDTLHWVCVLRT